MADVRPESEFGGTPNMTTNVFKGTTGVTGSTFNTGNESQMETNPGDEY